MDRKEDDVAENVKKEGETPTCTAGVPENESNEVPNDVGNDKEEPKAQGAPGLPDKELYDLLDNAYSAFLAMSAQLNGSPSDAPTADSTDAASSTDTEEAKGGEKSFQTLYEELKTVSLAINLGQLNYGPIMAEFTKLSEEVEQNEGGEDLMKILQTVRESVQHMSAAHAEEIQKETDLTELACMMAAVDLYPAEFRKTIKTEMTPPYLVNMMHKFFTKEIFYLPIKDLVLRFPDWLSTNEATLSVEEYETRVKQLDVMKKLCAAYESETPVESEEVKHQRFKTIMNLIRELKQYGNPPVELLDVDSPFNIDEAGAAADVEQQCCLM